METPLFSRTKRLFSDKMMKFWIDAAYRMFELINNPNPYDREAVKDVVAKAKPYCQDATDGLFKVCRALYAQGVTVIESELLAGTQVRGDLLRKQQTLYRADRFSEKLPHGMDHSAA